MERPRDPMQYLEGAAGRDVVLDAEARLLLNVWPTGGNAAAAEPRRRS